jgi:hypothetical protein
VGELTNLTFVGSTAINIAITADGQRCIQLHQSELTFTSIAVQKAAGGSVATVPVSNLKFDAENQRVIVPLQGTYNTGDSLLLTLNYTAFLGQSMYGLYVSSYLNDAGNDAVVVTTQVKLLVLPVMTYHINVCVSQFEATYAR